MCWSQVAWGYCKWVLLRFSCPNSNLGGSDPFLFLERFVQSAAPHLVPKRGYYKGLAFSHLLAPCFE
jgi:hypothetical protein